MATITNLSRVLNGWQRRLRLQRAARWAARGLLIGLALALAAGLVGLLQSRLLKNEFLLLALALAAGSTLTAALVAALWPLDTLKTARYFDRKFRLAERVSTALELSRQAQMGPLVQQQLDDAFDAARSVQPAHALRLRPRAREALAALVLMVLLGLTWFGGGKLFAAAQQARLVRQTADAQAAAIEKIINQVKNNDALSPEQKQALTAPLEQALNGLKSDPTAEGSVAVLTSAAEQLSALAGPETAAMTQALQEAGTQLAGQKGSPLQAAGQQLAAGNPGAAAAELARVDAGKLSQAQSAQLAGQLQSMADTLAATNPQLSTQLSQAAQALQSGNSAQAQQALAQAAKSLAQAGQQAAFAQAAGQAAGQMQQGAGALLAATGNGQPQPAGQGQGSSQNAQTGQTSGGGSGRGTAQGPVAAAGDAGSAPIQQGNGPGDGGLSGYEQIYAPGFQGGSGGPQVPLPSSGQPGSAIGQGPASPGATGGSLVPYQQVYSQYQQGNLQAIENGSIPFEFMQTIRDYFSSITP